MRRVNVSLRGAIDRAKTLRRVGGELERATNELLAAANDGTPQSFLSAYRALECIRRIYAPNWRDRETGWTLMSGDLAISLDADFSLLAKAAEAVRHGDVPSRQLADHVVNEARKRRPALLDFVRVAVRAAVDQHTKTTSNVVK